MSTFYRHEFRVSNNTTRAPYRYEAFCDGKHLAFFDESSLYDALRHPEDLDETKEDRVRRRDALRHFHRILMENKK